MCNNAAYPVGDPPGIVKLRDEATYDNLTPKRLPCEPDNFSRQAQIVEGAGAGFRGWSREGALELDLIVVRTKPLNNSSSARQRVNAKSMATSETH